MTILFTKTGCPKCELLKSDLDTRIFDNVQVMTLTEDDADALAMLAYYECVGLSEKQLPILVEDTDDRQIITGSTDIIDFLELMSAGS
jgi:hypothetical protein